VGFGEKVLGETYTADVKAVMESVRDNDITVAVSANATGKTHGAARVAVWWYKCFPNSQVYTAAAPPESNLKKLLWAEIGSIVETNPDLFKSDTATKLHVQSSAQSFLTGVTIPMSGTEAQRESKFAGKHSPHLLFIIDEGDAVPDEVYKGIESCMSGGHARLLIMFNPRAEVGEAYRMIRDGKANVICVRVGFNPETLYCALELKNIIEIYYDDVDMAVACKEMTCEQAAREKGISRECYKKRFQRKTAALMDHIKREGYI